MSKFAQFVDSQIDFDLQFFAPETKSVARMPQKFCFSGPLLANQATQFIARAALSSPSHTKFNSKRCRN
jgi:hypothetical protein